MTIELQTGLPGAGKTLFTLDRIEKLRRKTGRPVFYSGIPINKDKLPDWQPIDAEKWYEAPPEAIVVIDEAQRVFRPRAAGSKVPEYEAQLETHRHGGIDLVLMTQGPKLVSSHVRDLVGCHYHSVRQFGLQRATVHKWAECKVNVQSRSDSIKTQYAYNKEVYGWYKSAEAHTVKAAIPLKVWLLGALLVGLPLFAVAFYFKVMHKAPEANPANAAQVGQAGPSQGGPRDARTLTAAEYAKSFQPRIAGLVYTAPAYDKVTQPVRAPYPAACVQSKTRCQCYTQQGTRLETTEDLCKGISEGGFFMAWDDKMQTQTARALPVVEPKPKTGGDQFNGALNLTPGHTALGTQVAAAEQAQQDGDGIRAAHKKP
jgi:hypothetical protein